MLVTKFYNRYAYQFLHITIALEKLLIFIGLRINKPLIFIYHELIINFEEMVYKRQEVENCEYYKCVPITIKHSIYERA